MSKPNGRTPAELRRLGAPGVEIVRQPEGEKRPVSDKARIIYLEHAGQLAALRAAADHFERMIVGMMAEADGLDQEGRVLMFNREAFTWQIQA